MNKTDKLICALLTLVLFFSCMVVERAINKREDTEDMKPAATSVYDTSYLENWCGEPSGTIRMVWAEWFNYESCSNITTMKDETGELWVVRDVSIDENDFILLWLDDMGTDAVEDDQLVKVWIEAR